VGPEQREKLRVRVEKDPADVAAAAAVEPHARWLQETGRRLAFRALWQKYFETHDVFLCPAAFCAAFPHDPSQPMEKRVIETSDGPRRYLDLGLWASSALLSGLPATVAPVGRTDAGLPAGIQIVAPMWEDTTSIEFAALLAETIGGFTEPPAFRE
jgi:amidase